MINYFYIKKHIVTLEYFFMLKKFNTTLALRMPIIQ